ncbi:DUF6005 family protein [Skermanella mucosa]|uniref:DUF6005 family protein n=1 Tax=Skermanella mucosa TaxID=1789672 RepID=UPI00192AEB7D|nr:DUF6005 family protein [Skermanella mucosa]UEM18546.1 DUF6005 family protein [Skermanella mucosa]
MRRDDVVEAIRTVLRDHLRNRHLHLFGPEARLNEDLYLDSILMLEVFLQLELSFGLSVPDHVMTSRELATVADLAGLFAEGEAAPPAAPEPPPGSVHGEEYVDIKVHCFVSSVCDAVKRTPGIDHRPFYFGVWDADFAVGDGTPGREWTLLYHAPSISHDFFRHWFRRLYGPEVREWYDRTRSKAENLETLLDLVETRPDTLSVMAMVDLHHLPERENKFNQNPFPHYLMLETSADPEAFFVSDPDFRWEGEIAKDKIVNAFLQPTVAGGFAFDRADIHPPAAADLKAYFEACFHPDANPLTAAVRRIVAGHLAGHPSEMGGRTPADLVTALRELPVISIRKYAYEHGFAFFWRALGLPDETFLVHCDEIEELIQGFKALHYAVLRLAETGDTGLAGDIFERLDRLDELEFGIKASLGAVFRSWCAANGLRCDHHLRDAEVAR